MQPQGKYVHGEYHATSDTGGEITLYDQDGGTVTLAATERLCVASVTLWVDTSGDASVYLDASDDNTIDAGEVCVRGPARANGGITKNWPEYAMMQGQLGAKPHCTCVSGTIDVQLEGFIRTV